MAKETPAELQMNTYGNTEITMSEPEGDEGKDKKTKKLAINVKLPLPEGMDADTAKTVPLPHLSSSSMDVTVTGESAKIKDYESKKKGLPIDLGSSVYSGEPDDNQYLLRKLLGLPVKKALVYKTKKEGGEWDTTDVKEFSVTETYGITEIWSTVRLIFADRPDVLIHSGYLADMQTPGFEKKMKEMMEQSNTSD